MGELRQLRAALRKAVETHRSVTRDNIAVEIGNDVQTVNLIVEPIVDGKEAAFLIVFTDVGPVRSREEAKQDGALAASDDGAVQQLEVELRETKERLQATIEELETSNVDIFNVSLSDTGRKLTNFTNRLDDPSLEQEILRVFDRQQPIERRVTASNGSTHYLMRILPYRATDNSVQGVLLTFTGITSVIASEQHQRTLSAELSYRVKNVLTVVISIASQTATKAANLEVFLASYLGRLHALAFTHELLSEREWQSAPLRDLIGAELAPFVGSDTDRVRFDGPSALLKPRVALSLGMMLHELATNSLKYGALSVPKGRVEISWSVPSESSTSGRLELSWLESGGPALSGHVKRGFGSELIERAASFELGGEARLVFANGGLRCTISVPIDPDIVLRSE